jgi:hypothetical protein
MNTTSKVWEVMNELEMVTSKVCSAREMIDIVSESIQNRDYDRAEAMANAVYEFLGYYLEEFDERFKKAWNETVVKSKVDDGMRPWGHSDLEYQIANNKKYDYTATGEKFPLSCDKDDPSPECQGAWNDFWEEHYYPEETKSDGYSVNGLSHQELEAIREAGGYEWTPEPQVSRNDPTRLKYEGGWIYESPDGGKTVTKRKVGSTEKFVVKEDKVKKWVLPVEEVRDEDTDEDIYCVTFPDDLLEAANLKEGDLVEWVDLEDGSYRLEKVPKAIRMDEC